MNLFVRLLGNVLFAVRLLIVPRSAWATEMFALRHQVNVLQRQAPKRLRLTVWDRVIWVLLSKVWSGWREALVIVKPTTVVRWHRMGFRLFWRWKSRARGGRPKTDSEVRALIRRMARENPTWGAPKIHGELLKLGFQVAESTVSKYMPKRPGPLFSPGGRMKSGEILRFHRLHKTQA